VAPASFPGRGARARRRACKPNSVEDGHSSRRRITAALQQPTRRFRRPPLQVATRLGAPGRHALAAVGQAANSLPIWSCSVWGLPCPRLYSRGGALLPHLFTLTCRLRGRRYFFCGTGRLPALKPESRTLSGTLPCGVRTFLSRGACASRQRPPSPPARLSYQRRPPFWLPPLHCFGYCCNQAWTLPVIFARLCAA